jgi:hypothetical protein
VTNADAVRRMLVMMDQAAYAANLAGAPESLLNEFADLAGRARAVMDGPEVAAYGQQSGTDTELAAMAALAGAMRQLAPPARERALNWLVSIHGHGSAWEALSGAYRDLGLVVAELEGQLRSVDRERAHLVAFLAAAHLSTIGQDPEQPDWAVVYIDTPAGQLSWHIAPGDMDLFGHVELDSETVWDGHSTEVKYERLRKLTTPERNLER